VRRALVLVAVLFAAAAFGGCLGGDDGKKPLGAAAPSQRAASSAQQAAEQAEMRLVELHPLNHSGVHGAARLLLDGRRLGVESIASGATPGQMHMQHIHVPADGADGTCPTQKLDANHDGFVSLDEGLGSYGAPVVSLEPFPMSDGPSWSYAETLKVPANLPLDRGVVVLHGRDVHGKYDPLMPIACGVIAKAETREVALEPVNNSGIAGTARLALSGSKLYAWLSLGGPIDGKQHMQHIHVPEGEGRGSCPTPDMDRNGDGLVSLEEGLPAYGAPVVSLEPFPAPKQLTFEYSRTLNAPPDLPLDRGVVVVHGMNVNGKYDETIPVACGAIDPDAPAVGMSGSGSVSGGSTSGYGSP
jgi:EF hand domain-containing protein